MRRCRLSLNSILTAPTRFGDSPRMSNKTAQTAVLNDVSGQRSGQPAILGPISKPTLNAQFLTMNAHLEFMSLASLATTSLSTKP